MAKVKYYAKENSTIGTHSFYAVPIPNGTLTFDELLGGCTREEVIQSNRNSGVNGRLIALYDVQDCMRQNNGESPDVWCKNVWQYVCDEIDKLTNQE